MNAEANLDFVVAQFGARAPVSWEKIRFHCYANGPSIELGAFGDGGSLLC